MDSEQPARLYAQAAGRGAELQALMDQGPATDWDLQRLNELVAARAEALAAAGISLAQFPPGPQRAALVPVLQFLLDQTRELEQQLGHAADRAGQALARARERQCRVRGMQGLLGPGPAGSLDRQA